MIQKEPLCEEREPSHTPWALASKLSTAFAELPRKVCFCSDLPPDLCRPVTPSHSKTFGALAHLALSQLPTKRYRSVFHGRVSVVSMRQNRDQCSRGGLARTNRRGHSTLVLELWGFCRVGEL